MAKFCTVYLYRYCSICGCVEVHRGSSFIYGGRKVSHSPLYFRTLAHPILPAGTHARTKTTGNIRILCEERHGANG